MQNIFLELKQKGGLKREPLEKLLGIDPEEEEGHALAPVLDEYFEGQRQPQQAVALLLRLRGETQGEVHEKILAVLVFFLSRGTPESALKVIAEVCGAQEAVASRVRFLSLVFKSVAAEAVRRDVILRCLELLEQEGRLAIFSNFIENFPQLAQAVQWAGNERAGLYLRLVNFISKHVVYKKLWRKYLVEGLRGVEEEHANAAATEQLLVGLLGSGEVPTQALALLRHPALSRNKLYPFLEALLEGDHEAFSKQDGKLLAGAGLEARELERRVKIQALPRVLGGIKQASYEQVGQILRVEKGEVEAYIIEAIQEGLIQAKIDEFHETIIVKEANFRTLRGQERAALQKRMTYLTARLQLLASF